MCVEGEAACADLCVCPACWARRGGDRDVVDGGLRRVGLKQSLVAQRAGRSVAAATRVLARCMTSGAFRTIKPGTPVDSKQLATRALAYASHAFVLFDNLAGYVSGKDDRRAVLRGIFAGPVLHAPAAQGAGAVTQVGTAGPGGYMAFGMEASLTCT